MVSLSDTIHNILSVFHALIMTVFSHMVLFKYGYQDITDQALLFQDIQIIKSFFSFSIGYFLISTLFMLYDYLYHKKTDYQMVLHHIGVLATVISGLCESKYLKLVTFCYLIEGSSIFYAIRDQFVKAKSFGIGFTVTEICFAFSFFICRFTYILSIFYQALVNIDTSSYSYMTVMACSVTISALNIVWGSIIGKKLFTRIGSGIRRLKKVMKVL